MVDRQHSIIFAHVGALVFRIIFGYAAKIDRCRARKHWLQIVATYISDDEIPALRDTILARLLGSIRIDRLA
jgi:hypothetical protein